MIRYFILTAVLLQAGCARSSRPEPASYVGQWDNAELRETVHFTDAGQFLLKRDDQLGLGNTTRPNDKQQVDVAVLFQLERFEKQLGVAVVGDHLSLTLDGHAYKFNRAPRQPPSDQSIVGLWQFKDFEQKEFTSYGCVITSNRGGGVTMGNYTLSGNELWIEEPGPNTTQTVECRKFSYAVSNGGKDLTVGTAAFRRLP